MSTSPSTPDFPLPELSTADTALLRVLVRPVQAAAFWLAVVLPLAYLPALTIDVGTTPISIVAGLLAVNVVALIVGHGYNREGRGDRR